MNDWYLDPPEQPSPHPKSEEAWGILEDAGVDQQIIEKVCAIIDDLAVEADRECPRCLELMAQEDLEAAIAFAEEMGDSKPAPNCVICGDPAQSTIPWIMTTDPEWIDKPICFECFGIWRYGAAMTADEVRQVRNGEKEHG